MRWSVAVVSALATALVTGACSGAAPAGDPPPGTVRVLFAGDVMVGRGVAPVAAAEGPALFEGARHVVASADLAVANLESPLTDRPHMSADPDDLAADHGAAALLAGAGFDALALANNHAGDAGTGSVSGTMAALAGAGVAAVGAGANAPAARRPVVEQRHGVAVALLAYDLTGQGPAAAGGPGVVPWDAASAEEDVAAARELADVVTVGLHGGGEYGPRPDPVLRAAVAALAGWGVDVVWAHGAHVVYPIEVLDPNDDGRPTVAAYGLGNFLFDQAVPGTSVGAVVEVLAGRDGVVAYRVGSVAHHDLRVRFEGWEPPPGDAALVDGAWWALVAAVPAAPSPDVAADVDALGDVSAAAAGDVTGDGEREIVVAFRRPHRPTPVTEELAGIRWVDASGRSAHLGLYRQDTMDEVWVAGALGRPLAAVAACDGSVAVAHSTLDDPGIVAGGAWVWRGFGFALAADLAGAAEPGCADVDGDGTLDPVLMGRTGNGTP